MLYYVYNTPSFGRPWKAFDVIKWVLPTDTPQTSEEMGTGRVDRYSFCLWQSRSFFFNVSTQIIERFVLLNEVLLKVTPPFQSPKIYNLHPSNTPNTINS